MQLDSEAAALLGIASSVFSAGISYGIMKTKMDRLEREIEKVDGKYVTFPHFEAVVEPLRKAMGDMQKDIKKILSLVGGGDQRRKHQDED